MSRALTWIARPTILVSLAVLIAGLQIVRAVTRERPATPEVYGEVPEFDLQDHRGRSYGSDELVGRVWIASFLYTRCYPQCLIAQRLTKLQDSIKNATPYLHIVTFTVDPEYDTPKVLSAFAGRFKHSPRLWTFLTGESEAVQAAVSSLGVTVERAGMIAERPQIQFDKIYVLVDRQMRIRGVYDANSPDAEVSRMMHDAAVLLNYAE